MAASRSSSCGRMRSAGLKARLRRSTRRRRAASVAVAPAVTSRPPDLPSDQDVRELRLALVCYGGVSLAIYMHGITKELEKLTRASVLLAESPDENPFPIDRSEHAYFNALKRKA